MRILKVCVPGRVALTLGLVAGAWAASAGILLGQQSSEVGTWILEPAKSHFVPGPPPTSSTVFIKPYRMRPGLEVTTLVIRQGASSGETCIEYANQYDGKDIAVFTPKDWDTVAYSRLDSSTVERLRKKDGETVETYRRVVSEDGRSMTVSIVGTRAGVEVRRDLEIYRRQ
jgi:hypothetical protein